MNEYVLRAYDFKLIFEFELTEDDITNGYKSISGKRKIFRRCLYRCCG